MSSDFTESTLYLSIVVMVSTSRFHSVILCGLGYGGWWGVVLVRAGVRCSFYWRGWGYDVDGGVLYLCGWGVILLVWVRVWWIAVC